MSAGSFTRRLRAFRVPTAPAFRRVPASGTALAGVAAAGWFLHSLRSTASSQPVEDVGACLLKEVQPVQSTAAAKPKVLFVLGGPGAGKGTQCGLLVKEYGFVHLSAGDLLREECNSGSPDGAFITQLINEGKIVPVEITVKLLKKAMEKAGGSKFLIDGFPRNFDNLEGWHRVMGDSAEVEGVLFYDCPEHVMESRLLERGKTSGRSDDNPDVIRKRFKTYMDSTMPVINHYAKMDKTFHVIADRSVPEVFTSTRQLIDPVIKKEVLETYQRVVHASDAGDVATFDRHSRDDITFVGSTLGDVVGKDAVRAAFPGQKEFCTSSAITNADVRLLDGRTAVTSACVIKSATPVNGSTYAEVKSGLETRVWTYSEGRWQLVHSHASERR